MPSPRSVARVLAILERLAETPGGLTLAALSVALKTPKSSLLNLLRGLAAANYVTHSDGHYSLSAESFRLAGTMLAGRRFPETAHPTLRRLAEQSGETAMIAVPSPDRRFMVYVDKVESETGIRFTATIGSRRPLYCSCSGRAFLAFQPVAWRDKYLKETKLVAQTAETVIDKPALRALLERARAEGIATTRGDMTEGCTGVAAPIFDQAREAIGSIIVAGPTERMAGRLAQHKLLVKAAGRAVSQMMGYVEA